MTTTDGKRRLPLVKDTPSDVEEDRPAWHWAAIGTIALFLAWLPLLFLAHAAIAPLVPTDPVSAPPRAQAALIAVDLIALALASFVAGYLVGRVGARTTPREAMVSGFSAALLAWLVGVAGLRDRPVAWLLVLVVLLAVAGGFARLGGRRGRRARDRA